jgi:hypothetical protein
MVMPLDHDDGASDWEDAAVGVTLSGEADDTQ